MSVDPTTSFKGQRRWGLGARILFVVAGFVLAGGAAAMAYFTVNVIDGSGNNALAQATQLVAPASPTASSNNTSGTITVSWTPSTQPAGVGVEYQVIRTSGPGAGTVVCTAEPANTTSCPDTGLTAGTTYGYTVTAYLDNWQASATTSATTATPTFSIALSGGPYTAGAPVTIQSITAIEPGGGNITDMTYTGSKTITWSGLANSPAPSSTAPAYPSGSVTFTNGVASPGSFTAYDAGSNTVTATDANATSVAGSATISVGDAGIDHFAVGAPASATAGSQITGITLTAQDLYDNTATSYPSGNHTITWSGPSISPAPASHAPTLPTSTVSFTGGVSTTSLSATLYFAGTNPLTASDGSGKTGSTMIAVGDAGIDHFLVGASGSATAGSQVTGITLTAQDVYDNTATSYANGNHAITWSGPSNSPAPASHAPALPTSTVSFNGGVSTTSLSATLYDAGSNTLTATDSSSKTGSATIAVVPTSPNQLVYTTQPPATGTAGSALTNFKVAVEDTYNNIETTGNTGAGDTITLSVASGPGSFNSTSLTYTNVAASNGTATFSGIYLDTAGSYTFKASDTQSGDTGLATATSSPATTIAPAAAASYTLSNVPTSVTAGSSFVPTITVKDAYGNVATNYTGTVHFTSTDSQASLPANYTFTSGDNGVRTFTNGVTFKTAPSQTFTATDTVNSGVTVTSSSVTVNPAAAASYTLSNVPTSVTAGSSFVPTITVKDAYGNVATNYTGTVHFTSTDSQASLPANYTFTSGDNGVRTFTNGVTFKTAPSQTFTATDTVNSGVTVTSSSVTVNPAAAASYTLSNVPTSVTAGSSFVPTITVKDAYGNVATNYTGTVHFTSTDSQASLPANYTFTSGDNGVRTFTNGVTFKTAPSQTFTATDTVNSGVTVTSSSVTVNPAGAASLSLSAASTTPTAGAGDNLTITALDPYGNTATGYSGSKTLSFTGASTIGSFNPTVTNSTGTATAFNASPNTAIAFTNGVASVSGSNNGVMVLYKAGAATIVVSDGTFNNGSGLPVTVGPASPNKLVYTTQPPASGTAGSALTTFKVAVEDTYGNIETTGSSGATDNITLSLATKPTGGAFSSLSSTYTNVAASNGTSTFSSVALNDVGSYTITASDTQAGDTGLTTATSTPATVISAGTASKIAISSGSNQFTTVSTAFAAPLVALVTDSQGNPVSGATVLFTAPASGASGTFLATANGGTCLSSGGSAVASCTATTNASGLASSLTYKANGSVGIYNVSATSSGTTPSPLNFVVANTTSGTTLTLTPTSGAAASTVAVSGGGWGANGGVSSADFGTNALTITGGSTSGHSLSGSFTVPSLPQGTYLVFVLDSHGNGGAAVFTLN